VVGCSCSGKTTLALRLAAALGHSRIELDALYWLADWEARSDAEFREEVARAIARPHWVVDGNYRTRLQGLVWSEATAVVWLDYSFPRTFVRALRRTFRRVFTRERIYAGNIESFRHAFLSRDSILWWVVIIWRKNRRELEALKEGAKGGAPRFFVFRRPAEAETWLAAVEAAQA